MRHTEGLFVQLKQGEFRYAEFEGASHLVVPVIMARADVPMNGGLITVEEMVPWAWNGVPVTVGHPMNQGVSIEANDPEVLQEWAVGRVFNARVDGIKLRAEAWINVEKAEQVYPGLIQMLEGGEQIDVSTGYFCDPEPAAGRVNGRVYNELHRNLRPEHLALLPDEQGACDFASGCGVRSNALNLRKELKMKLTDAVKALKLATNALEQTVSKMAIEAPGKAKKANTKKVTAKATPKGKTAKGKPSKARNERGSDDDHRQMVADLISSDDSPFLPEDEDSLRMMSRETLRKMRDSFLRKSEDDEDKETMEDDEEEEAVTMEDDEEEEVTNADEDEDVETAEDEEEEQTMKRKNSADGDLAAMLSKLNDAVTKLTKNSGLSSEDREALQEVRRMRKERRNKLIQHIVANTNLPEKKVQGFDMETLETLAGGVVPTANYGGRATPRKENAKDKDDPAVKAMTENIGDEAVIRLINERRKAAR